MHVCCEKCGIEDILDFSKNVDEVFLEFLSRFDQGLIAEKGLSEELKEEGIIRSEKEIKDIVGNNKPDKVTEEILFSKKDYVSQYKVLKNPEPEMGCNVEDLGLNESVAEHLKELGIEQFYKFQEEAIREIVFGENVIIEAPTAIWKNRGIFDSSSSKSQKRIREWKCVCNFRVSHKSTFT